MYIENITTVPFMLNSWRILRTKGKPGTPMKIRLWSLEPDPTGQVGSFVEYTIVEEVVYPDFLGDVSLDFTDAIMRFCRPLLPRIGARPDATIDKTYKEVFITAGTSTYRIIANFYALPIWLYSPDIDYLVIPLTGCPIVRVSAFAPRMHVFIEVGGERKSLLNESGLANNGSGYYSVAFDVSREVRIGEPFRLGVTAEETITSYAVYSCVYECRNARCQEFWFYDIYGGGYIYLPFFGDLEENPEYEFETVQYANRYETLQGGPKLKRVQHTGYITTKVMKLLHRLVLSPVIYWRMQTIQRRIYIVSADLPSNLGQGLQSGTFSFILEDRSYQDLSFAAPSDISNFEQKDEKI